MISLVVIIPLRAEVTYAQKTEISVVMRATVEEVLHNIEEQSEFYFLYNSKLIDVDRQVEVDARGSDIFSVLDEIFAGTGVSYGVFDRQIILARSEFTRSGSSAMGTVQQDDGNITVSGIVRDDKGEPILGAGVVVEGTSRGVTTGQGGRFTLRVPPGSNLLVSFIGYETKTVAVGNQTVLDIQLEADIIGLEDVVVVGYGSQRKVSTTGAIAAVKGDELVKSPAMNVLNTLAGRLPGVVINSRSDEPGRESISVMIRGRSSTRDENTQPLYIIDGVERGGLGQINPNDIESISVLKDASAAIYGSRSANGVILITTKRGAAGKPTISLSFNQSFTQPTRNPKLADSYTFAKVWNETNEYDGRPWQYTQEELDKFRDGTDPYYPSTDWYDVMLRKLTPQHRTNASVTGGNDNVSYFVSFGEAKQKGHFQYGNTKVNQYNVRSNIDVKITDWMSASVNLAGRQDKKNYPWFPTFDAYSHLFLYLPTYMPYWPGTDYLYPCRDGDNLINLLSDDGGFDKQNIQSFQSTFSTTIRIPWIEGLSVYAGLSYDTSNNHTKRFEKPTYVYDYDRATDTYTRVRANRGVDQANLSDRNDRAYQTYFNARVNYDKSFGDHTIGLMAGYEQTEGNNNYVWASRSNFISTVLPEIERGSPDPQFWGTGGSAGQEARQSVFGRANYDYRGKYLAEVTMRYDGSTIFPKDNRFGFFPSVLAAWRISEEEFMSGLTSLNNLKLRLSYGEMGSDRIDGFQYLQFYNAGNNYVIGGQDVSGITTGTYPNPNITWETAKTWNTGVDVTLWNGMLGVEFDYFHTRRSGMLVQRNALVPTYIGLSLPTENIGKMQNQGMELILSHTNYRNEFKYSISGNFSFARNKVLYIDEAPAAEDYQYRTGRPWGAGLYYKYLGVFQTQEQLDSYPAMAGYGLGDPMFEDVNGDGVIDSRDAVMMNYTQTPEIVFGLNFAAQYKGFDLSVLFQGQENAYRNLAGHNAKLNYGWGNFFSYRAEDRWSLDNPTGTKPRANTLARGTENSTLWYVNDHFLRLKNVELGYTLPSRITDKIGFGSIRVSVSGYNLCLLYDSMKK